MIIDIVPHCIGINFNKYPCTNNIQGHNSFCQDYVFQFPQQCLPYLLLNNLSFVEFLSLNVVSEQFQLYTF